MLFSFVVIMNIKAFVIKLLLKLAELTRFSLLFDLTQVVASVYNIHQKYLSKANVMILLEILSSTASHAHQLNSDVVLRKKLQRLCFILEVPGPPIVSFENDSYKVYLSFLGDMLRDNPSMSMEMKIEQQFVALCESILQMYLNCTKTKLSPEQRQTNRPIHCRLPLSLARKEELTTRSALVVLALRELSGLECHSFKQYVTRMFPLLVNLVRVEHSDREVQKNLSEMFRSHVGSMIMID